MRGGPTGWLRTAGAGRGVIPGPTRSLITEEPSYGVDPLTSTADWAKAYAAIGWRSFPVWPGEKRPLYSGWPKDASTDPALLDRYFANPENNVGVVCGEVFDAWDIEAQHLELFNAWLWMEGHELPEGPLAQTGRGGWHYLTAPTGEGHTRKLYIGPTHIGELKSTGGFILVSPSTTEQQYRWLWRPDKMAVQPAPDWLKALIRRPMPSEYKMPWSQVSLSPQADIVPLVATVRATVEGNRNDALHWAANRAYDDGIPQSIATDELMAAFVEVSRSDENRQEREHEARATIASAYAR